MHFWVVQCGVVLPCCCFDAVSHLLTAQSAAHSRALIKQTFGDTYSYRQHSGQSELLGPPLLPHVPILPAYEYLTETETCTPTPREVELNSMKMCNKTRPGGLCNCAFSLTKSVVLHPGTLEMPPYGPGRTAICDKDWIRLGAQINSEQGSKAALQKKIHEVMIPWCFELKYPLKDAGRSCSNCQQDSGCDE